MTTTTNTSLNIRATKDEKLTVAVIADICSDELSESDIVYRRVTSGMLIRTLAAMLNDGSIDIDLVIDRLRTSELVIRKEQKTRR